MSHKLLELNKTPKQTTSQKHGVYSEIAPDLFDRLQDRRRKNRKLGLKLDSNYKIIEAAISMILDYFDSNENKAKTSDKEAA